MRDRTPKNVCFVLHFEKSNDDYSNQVMKKRNKKKIRKKAKSTKKDEKYFNKIRTDEVNVQSIVHIYGHRLSTHLIRQRQRRRQR